MGAAQERHKVGRLDPASRQFGEKPQRLAMFGDGQALPRFERGGRARKAMLKLAGGDILHVIQFVKQFKKVNPKGLGFMQRAPESLFLRVAPEPSWLGIEI